MWLILCCCWTCDCTMNKEEISMKNIEYCDLLLYCTIESSRQCMDFQDHYWIKIIGIMIVWDPNDWRISATTSENWEEYLFSGETSFFLPNYVSTRDITRSNPIITNGSSKASIGVQDGISGLQLDLCIILFWCPKWSILLLKQIQVNQEIKALTVNGLYCTWSSS